MGFRNKGIKDGKLELGKYNIEPTTNVEMLQSDEFNVIKTKNGIVYTSKNPLELCGSNFWVTIYFEGIHIKKVELSNADEKYKANYQTMDNDFLLNNLGSSYKENLSGREYEYQWGKIMSYFDIKSAEAGIVICYF